MKTISEWLYKAKQQGYEWADAAIRNHDPEFSNLPYTSLYEALAAAFTWGASPEGHSYWEGVSESLSAYDAGYRVLSPTTPVTPTSLDDLIECMLDFDRALKSIDYPKDLKEPYRTQVYEATKASYEEQLAEVKADIAKALGLKERKPIGWVVANTIDMVYLIGKPEKVEAGWSLTKPLTPEEAISLCGRVPKWNDEEPTPIYE